MGKTKNRPLFALPEIDPQIDLRGNAGNPEVEAIRLRFFREHGVKSAAWLVWTKRRAFLSTGTLHVRIPRDTSLPPWFLLAVEALRLRKKSWSVIEQSMDDGSRGFVIMWKRWRRQ